MVFNRDYKLEQYALNAPWDSYPDDVQERACACAIDLFGALILGSQGEQFKVGLKLAKQLGLAGETPILGANDTFNMLGASIAMGHSSNSFDIDDGLNLIKGHPGTSFIGGFLAAALKKNIPYKDFLTILVKGYEITIRWALSMQDHYGYLHSTGTYGSFGTALTQGLVIGLSKEQLNNALSIADFHAPITPVMRAVEYPSMNKDGVPFGVMIGTMSVLETEAGETGRTHLLEMPEYAHYLESLGKKFYIQNLYFKPYTCCRWAHQPIYACQQVMKAENFSYEQIDRVVINTFDSAARLYKEVPHDTDEAQYNIAFPVAASLVYGDVGFAQINNQAVRDKTVLEMMKRLEFRLDPEMEKEFPEKRLAWVEIILKDGKRYKSKVYEAPGEHTDPELNTNWIIRKFHRITSPILSDRGQDEILKLLCRCSEIPMREIVACVNRHLDQHGEVIQQ